MSTALLQFEYGADMAGFRLPAWVPVVPTRFYL